MSLRWANMSSRTSPARRRRATRLMASLLLLLRACGALVALILTTGCQLGPGCGCDDDDGWLANERKAALRSAQLANNSSPAAIVRGQNPNLNLDPNLNRTFPAYPSTGYGAAPNSYPTMNGGSGQFNSVAPGFSDQTRQPMPASGTAITLQASYFQPQPGSAGALPPPPGAYGQAPAYGPGAIGSGLQPQQPIYGQPGLNGGFPNGPGAPFQPNSPFAGPQTNPAPIDPTADIDVVLQETQTGRFQFGVGVNSDAGITGQIVVDERNFDWQRIPTSYQDWINGTAFRGAGQGFRLEAMPGNQVQRYMVSFTEPYLFVGAPLSLNLSAFFYNRRFFDWDEERLGGRLALGYRASQDLSLTAAVRAENVKITQPRVLGIPDLDRALGDTDFYSGRLQLTHDTRDMPFFPSEGHYFEVAFEQAFGEFSYPRGEIDYRKYFLVRERPDGSGRHTLAYSFRVGISGDDTPIFENYFTGGYSTMRGFDFRGASPVQGGVTIGGHARFLGSVEYFFPLTADDMVKGVAFCDFGTTERQLAVDWDNYRVAPGLGLRLNIPALGPAPLALDFAVPVARSSFDNVQNFSFFMGFAR